MVLKLHPLVLIVHEKGAGRSARLGAFLSLLQESGYETRAMMVSDKIAERAKTLRPSLIAFLLETAHSSLLTALDDLQNSLKNVAVLVASHDFRDDLEQQAFKYGAEECIVLNQVSAIELGRLIHHAILRHQERTSGLPPETLVLNGALLGVFDRLPVGISLVDQDGKIVVMNRTAKAILDQRDGLWVDASWRYHADTGHLTKELSNAIRATFESPDHAQDDQLLVLPRPSQEPPLAACVALAENSGVPSPARFAIVFITDPAAPILLDVQKLKLQFSLTNAEARLAIGLAQGGVLDDLARQYSVSSHTLRTQLKEVFRKTGTSRQSELVKLLVTSPAIILPGGNLQNDEDL